MTMDIRVITPLSANQEYDFHKSYTIFLAGGCTTNWRDDFVSSLSRICKHDNIIVFSPFCDPKKITLKELLFWEREHLFGCNMLVFNFEGSESTQAGSMFELGRFANDKALYGDVLINIDDNYKLKREVEIQVGFMNADNEQIDKSKHIELFYSQFDGMVEVCNEIIDERLENENFGLN